MLHPETEHRRAEVVPDTLFLCIEPHALSDDRFVWLACRAPNRERHLESYGWCASFRFVLVLVVEVRWTACLVGRHIPAILVSALLAIIAARDILCANRPISAPVSDCFVFRPVNTTY